MDQEPTPLAEVDLNQPLRLKPQPEANELLKNSASAKAMPKQLLGHSGGGQVPSQQQENSQATDFKCDLASPSIVKPLNIGKRKSAALDKENRASRRANAQPPFESQNAKPAHKKKRRQRIESPQTDSQRHGASPVSEGSASSDPTWSPRAAFVEERLGEAGLGLGRIGASKQVKEYPAAEELQGGELNQFPADFSDLINREKSNGEKHEFEENQSIETSSLESVEADLSDEGPTEADPSTEQLIARKIEIERKLKMF